MLKGVLSASDFIKENNEECTFENFIRYSNGVKSFKTSEIFKKN